MFVHPVQRSFSVTKKGSKVFHLPSGTGYFRMTVQLFLALLLQYFGRIFRALVVRAREKEN